MRVGWCLLGLLTLGGSFAKPAAAQLKESVPLNYVSSQFNIQQFGSALGIWGQDTSIDQVMAASQIADTQHDGDRTGLYNINTVSGGFGIGDGASLFGLNTSAASIAIVSGIPLGTASAVVYVNGSASANVGRPVKIRPREMIASAVVSTMVSGSGSNATSEVLLNGNLRARIISGTGGSFVWTTRIFNNRERQQFSILPGAGVVNAEFYVSTGERITNNHAVTLTRQVFDDQDIVAANTMEDVHVTAYGSR